MHRRDTIRTILTVAGSDSTGGAGMQADIKTATVFGVYSASVITAVTAQTPVAVEKILTVSPDMIMTQFDSIYKSMRPDAIKIGMIPDAPSVECIINAINKYKIHNIVIDPVLCASTGDSLTGITENTLAAMKQLLFPLTDLLTPNIPEAERITGIKMGSGISEEELCIKIKEITGSSAVLLKGGHTSDDYSTDYLYNGSTIEKYRQLRINSKNTHGTGCALSTAIACGIAKGMSLSKAVRMAKDFISYAIHEAAEMNIVKENGPLYIFSK